MSVGKNIPHDSARTHVTGKSVFVDDRIRLKNEVQVGVMGAPVSAGHILSIEYSEALKVPGVLGIFTGADFHHNLWGTIVEEQPILAHKKIGYIDEPMVLIAAAHHEAILEAKKKIIINVEETKPILTIEEAIEQKSILCQATPFIRGNVTEAIAKAPRQL